MCLKYIKEKTAELRQRKSIIAYKVLRLSGRDLASVHFAGPSWQPGELISNRRGRRLNQAERDCRLVRRGIHVYLDRSDAEKETGKLLGPSCKYRLVPVRCHAEDLIAAGVHEFYPFPAQAVYRSVHLSKSAHAKAVRQPRGTK